MKLENQNVINSHVEKIAQLIKEVEIAKNKADNSAKLLKGFVTSSLKSEQICPKPFNNNKKEILISDKITNFDKVKIEDCEDVTDDDKTKKEKNEIFLELKEKFQKTALHSSEKGECSKQESSKQNEELKQKDNKNKSPSV